MVAAVIAAALKFSDAFGHGFGVILGIFLSVEDADASGAPIALILPSLVRTLGDLPSIAGQRSIDRLLAGLGSRLDGLLRDLRFRLGRPAQFFGATGAFFAAGFLAVGFLAGAFLAGALDATFFGVVG